MDVEKDIDNWVVNHAVMDVDSDDGLTWDIKTNGDDVDGNGDDGDTVVAGNGDNGGNVVDDVVDEGSGEPGVVDED